MKCGLSRSRQRPPASRLASSHMCQPVCIPLVNILRIQFRVDYVYTPHVCALTRRAHLAGVRRPTTISIHNNTDTHADIHTNTLAYVIWTIALCLHSIPCAVFTMRMETKARPARRQAPGVHYSVYLFISNRVRACLSTGWFVVTVGARTANVISFSNESRVECGCVGAHDSPDITSIGHRQRCGGWGKYANEVYTLHAGMI